MDAFEFSSCVRGHHIYKSSWTPILGEELECRREAGNSSDPYAIAVIRMSAIVGHVSRQISAACSLFLQKDGSSICSIITGSRRYSSDLPQGGLKVPCLLRFSGSAKEIAKVRRLLTLAKRQLDVESPLKKNKINPVPDDLEVNLPEQLIILYFLWRIKI